MRRSKGITLVETIVVILIILIVATTLWMTLGPEAKRRGLESRVTVELRQVAAAVRLYMADYDGSYPNFLHNLDGVYDYPRGFKEYNTAPNAVYGEYLLVYSLGARAVEKYYPVLNRFDPQRDPIVIAGFLPRCYGWKNLETFVSLEEGYTTWSKVEDCYDLGVRLDGSVGRFSRNQKWHQEVKALTMSAVFQWQRDGKPPL